MISALVLSYVGYTKQSVIIIISLNCGRINFMEYVIHVHVHGVTTMIQRVSKNEFEFVLELV